MAIIWRDNLAIGVEEIDNQHRAMFDNVDSLYEACNTGKGREEIGNMLGFLDDYVVKHFSDEEFIMKKFSYPDYPKHKETHTRFMEDFRTVKEQYKLEGAAVNIVLQVNKLLIDWLTQHIEKMDRELAKYIKKQ